LKAAKPGDRKVAGYVKAVRRQRLLVSLLWHAQEKANEAVGLIKGRLDLAQKDAVARELRLTGGELARARRELGPSKIE